MIIAFYFMLKALIVLEIFAFLSWISGYVEKLLDKKAIVDLIMDWLMPQTGQQYLQYTICPISQEVKATRQ